MSATRTNIEIEDTYIQAIMERYGVRTKTAAVDLALRHLAGQPMTRKEALSMEGAHAIDEKRECDLRRLLGRFQLVGFDAVTDFDGAVTIYRRCRAAGVTPRGMID